VLLSWAKRLSPAPVFFLRLCLLLSRIRLQKLLLQHDFHLQMFVFVYYVDVQTILMN